MAQSFERVSLRIPKGQEKAAEQALKRVEEHILRVAPHWSKLTPDQRQKLLEHSPVLAAFIELAYRFQR